MSKFLHAAAAAADTTAADIAGDDTRAMTIPRRFLRKQPS